MSESIKKRHASNIYFGVHKKTGKLMHISTVNSGIKCGCICAACGQQLEARKGSIRRHHFAHISNYECMYSSEISIYKALEVILNQEKKIALPAVTLCFHSWSKPEMVQDAKEVTFDSIEFACEHLAYPPDLFLRVGDNRLRLILDFNKYYDNRDKRLILEAEAKDKGYSCLMYHVPSVDNDEAFTLEQLKLLLQGAESAEWIHNRIEEKWRRRFYEVAEEPEEHGSGFICPIHIGYYKGRYSARWTDCAYCRYNVAEPPSCLCTARYGIQSVKDFSLNSEVLKQRVEKIRAANDEKRAHAAEREIQRRTIAKPVIHTATLYKQPVSPPTKPTQEEYEAEEKRIAEVFDPQASEWTMDRYGRRWIKCRICGKIRLDTAMADYGGRFGPNQGICSECLKKGDGIY